MYSFGYVYKGDLEGFYENIGIFGLPTVSKLHGSLYNAMNHFIVKEIREGSVQIYTRAHIEGIGIFRKINSDLEFILKESGETIESIKGSLDLRDEFVGKER